jgi:SAM-dependent methyltransferase
MWSVAKALTPSYTNEEGTRWDGEEEFYNLTHLDPAGDLARYRFAHRDFIAHAFRYVHAAMVLGKMKPAQCAVLDVGCGTKWPVLTALHSNKVKPGYFMGVDARDCLKNMPAINDCIVQFRQLDVSKELPAMEPPGYYDLIISFECIEHMPKARGQLLLDNLAKVMHPNTLLLFSTPCYDAAVGMADNHIHEWTYTEMKEELETRFRIQNHFGTFASIKDYVPTMNEAQLAHYNKLREYYNVDLISCMFAPLYPERSRNCLWHLRLK